MSLNLNLPDAAATQRLGAGLAAGVKPGTVLHLRGELGSGKTTLVRGLLHGLGYPGRVKSPTYTLVEPYELSSLHFYHFDFYRLRDATEWLSSGFRDYFAADSLCVVEWPAGSSRSLYAAWRGLAFFAALFLAGTAHAQVVAGRIWPAHDYTRLTLEAP